MAVYMIVRYLTKAGFWSKLASIGYIPLILLFNGCLPHVPDWLHHQSSPGLHLVHWAATGGLSSSNRQSKLAPFCDPGFPQLVDHASPHHFAIWFRTHGLAEDWRRFKERSEGRYRKWLCSSVLTFTLCSVIYAIVFQLAIQKPMNEFGFGLFNIADQYSAIPEHGIEAMPGWLSLHLLGEALISAVAIIHYYFDSFIWKVRDEHVQEGL